MPKKTALQLHLEDKLSDKTKIERKKIILTAASKFGTTINESSIQAIEENSIKEVEEKLALFCSQLIEPQIKGVNTCQFSPCRQYRYQLTHSWDDLFESKEIAFIGLNPSTADEHKLDPTLRRIKRFCQAWGYNTFHMLNMFGYRSTLPKGLKEVKDPVGEENTKTLQRFAESGMPVVFCWGTNGNLLKRNEEVFKIFQGKEKYMISKTKNGHPEHPLYLSKELTLKEFSEQT